MNGRSWETGSSDGSFAAISVSRETSLMCGEIYACSHSQWADCLYNIMMTKL
jgi:hypothetical protein